ncbi:hypothetical protein FSP39_018733 [Pinctada imbricata]|uniref:JmjC domain-containing protein n=1 Tax=Pinctada imbricata TaxID=66713 RepID=A0AA89BKZ6_PINIB|nr:hypothetical protein FSP39_018733 [Pinctada imbricata]
MTSEKKMKKGVTEEDISLMFRNLHSKALKLGLKEADFVKLQSLAEIKSGRKSRKSCSVIVLVTLLPVLFLTIAIMIPYFTNWPVSRSSMVSTYFEILDLEPEKEQCLVEAIEYMAEMARPPTTCEFCRGVKRVEKVEKMSPERFEARYAYTSRPVIITDATKNWTAQKVFSYSFFKEIYSEGSPALENVESDCQFFPYRTNFTNLREVFEMNDDRALMKNGAEPWYIGWSNCDFSAANTLRQHYERPYFLPYSAESSKTDWIFMGSPGYGAALHIDNVQNPSWQAQVTGTKKWTLEPPPECYFQCQSSIEVVVDPGDIIVIDTNRWYHSTLNVGDDISITIGSEYD